MSRTPPSKGRIVAQWIVFLVFGGFGIVLAYVGVTQSILQRRMLAAAQPIVATIVHSEVFKSTSSDTDTRLGRDNSTSSYRPDVRFRYSLAEVEYESDLLYPTIIVRGYASAEDAAAELTPYPVGASVMAHVDPANPGKAFLIAERTSLPTAFIWVGLGIVPLAWFGSKLV
ncbi:MAG: DUF3592 domain-containing protein [Phycisphaerales bacterium]